MAGPLSTSERRQLLTVWLERASLVERTGFEMLLNWLMAKTLNETPETLLLTLETPVTGIRASIPVTVGDVRWVAGRT